MAEILRFTVATEYNGIKAGRYLRSFCKLSSRTLNILKRTEGGITVNGELLRTIDLLKAGDTVELRFPDEESNIEPVEGDLSILYEDSYLLIVNKPSSMPVHPVKQHQNDTLANIIAHRCLNTGSDFVFRAVNRLDSNTSGAVIVAKDRHTAALLQSGNIEKHYIAVCHGKTSQSGTIDEPIILHPDSKIVRTVSSQGQRAVTHYQKILTNNEMSVVDVVLETGRTHQIRCHMSYIGHPLLGDDLYGGSVDLISRQALHCKSVQFIHPYTSESIYVEAPIPNDIKQLTEMLTNQNAKE